MKREELLIFYSFWLRCFVVMMQYVGFLGRSQLFGSQVKVGAPTWQLARANSRVGAPTAKLARQLGAPTLELARANSGFGARQVPHSSSSFAPFKHSLSLLGISRYHASKATQEGQGEEGDSHRLHVCPAPAPAEPPNPEVQPVVDAHIANVGSEHFPGGYFPIPYTLTSLDAESLPQLPPLREPLEAALFGKWDQPGNPHLVWRIDATRVNFALTRGVLSRFCCAVMGRYPTTLAVELKLSQATLEAFNKTLKLCTAAASKEFVNVLDLQEMPPQGLDPEEQWLWVDPVKKSGWTHRTATDAVVRYQTVKVPSWDAVAPTEFSTNRRLRTHIPDITHPTLYSTDAPFTMLGMGCPHPSFHNSYPVANHDIPNPPIVTEEGFAAAGYRQYDRIIPQDLWARLAELATVELNPSMLEEVDLQAPGEGGGRY